jgi:lipopolysaccharide transport system permease protein
VDASTLLLDPSLAAEEWPRWRELAQAGELDDASAALVPLLWGRLLTSTQGAQDPAHLKLLGICKRAWAQNQLHYRRLTRLWSLLQREGASPLAVCGCAAWSLVYEQERSVRPIASLEILIPRDRALLARQLLEAEGWVAARGMPQPEGRVLDQFEGLWFHDADQFPLFLAWRLRHVSPEMASGSEPVPSRAALQLHGTQLFMLSSEELLASALQRPHDPAIGWQGDIVVLLRNRALDWRRVSKLIRASPEAVARLTALREQYKLAVPPSVLQVTSPPANRLLRRISGLWTNSRQVAWAEGRPHSFFFFMRYALQRWIRGFSTLSPRMVVDASRRSSTSSVAEYAHYRSLFYLLTRRDIQLRYSKTWRGILWALLQPLLPMLIFAAIFARVIHPSLQQGPYWLFVLVALAPWLFFANAVNYASVTFIGNLNLIAKVYFPRAILPAASVAAFLLDLFVVTSALLPVAWWQHHPPGPRLLLLPLVLLAAALMAATVGLAAASLNALNRDIKPLVPFVIQVWLYATPVLYPLSMLPRLWQRLLWLNPMTAVVELFRSALLGSPVDWPAASLSLAAFLLIALAALLLFRSVESGIAERL